HVPRGECRATARGGCDHGLATKRRQRAAMCCCRRAPGLPPSAAGRPHPHRVGRRFSIGSRVAPWVTPPDCPADVVAYLDDSGPTGDLPTGPRTVPGACL